MARTVAALGIVVGGLVAMTAGCAPGAFRAGEATTAPAPAPRFEDHAFSGPAGSRSYRLYLPAAQARSGAVLPLVVMLHGCMQDAAALAAATRMNAVAEELGFVVVYPEQTADANPQRCWNWYLPEHRVRDTGEAAIITGIVREVAQRYRVDAGRVYVAGISAGGAMALAVAATHPDLFAAVGVHSGVMFGAVSDVPGALAAMQGRGLDPRRGADALRAALGDAARPIPAIVVHGAADAVVVPANAEAIAEQWVLAYHAMSDSGVPAPAEETVTEAGGRRVRRAIHSDANGAPLVERWSVEGLGHAWSGGLADGSFSDPAGPDASREIARFLLQHRRR
jgi:poly(hydroxyalkanoate) depolymerase family esterase